MAKNLSENPSGGARDESEMTFRDPESPVGSPSTAVPDVSSGFLSPELLSFLIWMIFAGASLALGTLTGLWFWSVLVLQPERTYSFIIPVMLLRGGFFLGGALLVIYGLLACPYKRDAWIFIAIGVFSLLVENFIFAVHSVLH